MSRPRRSRRPAPKRGRRLTGAGASWRSWAIAGSAALIAVVALYFLWLRDSSLVAVDEVKVEGVTANREEVTAALDAAGREQTTLHVSEDELREVAGSFPTIAAIDADAGFPSSLTIRVTERLPVGVIRVRGEEIGVASDGLLLQGLDVSEETLPRLEAEPQSGRLDEQGTAQAEVLGAAPRELLQRVTASTYDLERGGVVLEMDAAPELRFGGPEDAAEKWRAAIAVLANPELGSPAYADVSVPTRVVTGG